MQAPLSHRLSFPHLCPSFMLYSFNLHHLLPVPTSVHHRRGGDPGEHVLSPRRPPAQQSHQFFHSGPTRNRPPRLSCATGPAAAAAAARAGPRLSPVKPFAAPGARLHSSAQCLRPLRGVSASHITHHVYTSLHMGLIVCSTIALNISSFPGQHLQWGV
jgi:hypothetical protein